MNGTNSVRSSAKGGFYRVGSRVRQPTRGLGLRRLQIVSSERRAWHWDALPPNGDDVLRLTETLAQFARRKVPDLPLFYMQP